MFMRWEYPATQKVTIFGEGDAGLISLIALVYCNTFGHKLSSSVRLSPTSFLLGGPLGETRS